MSDLIDRQAAIDAINHICPVDTEYDCTLLDRVDVRYALSDLPSAEPEIVHCKDCKYYNPIGVCIEMSSAVCENSFCCWAERRTDETDD